MHQIFSHQFMTFPCESDTHLCMNDNYHGGCIFALIHCFMQPGCFICVFHVQHTRAAHTNSNTHACILHTYIYKIECMKESDMEAANRILKKASDCTQLHFMHQELKFKMQTCG